MTWDTVAFTSPWHPRSRGHVLYTGPDGEHARRLQAAFAARLNRWKDSYAVCLLKDGRTVGSISR